MNQLLVANKINQPYKRKININGKFVGVAGMAALLAACNEASTSTPSNIYKPNATDHKFFNVIQARQGAHGDGYVRWNSDSKDQGIETILFYKFNEVAAGADYATEAKQADFVTFTEAQRIMTREVIQEYADKFGLTFVELAPDDTSIAANITISGITDMSSGDGDQTLGYATLPEDDTTQSKIMILVNAEHMGAQLKDTVIHELGHSIGLKHPFDEGGLLTKLTDSKEVSLNTVMSYEHGDGFIYGQLLTWDVEALNYLYGTNAASNVTYVYSAANKLVTITGSNGNDIFAGSSINDVINAGDGNDTIFAGYGDDIIYGENGDDIIYGSGGNDTIVGGAGRDSAVITATEKGQVTFEIDKDGGKIKIIFEENHKNSDDSLQSVETLVFDDGNGAKFDFKDLWSSLSTADNQSFGGESTTFNSWLINDYGYENIA